MDRDAALIFQCRARRVHPYSSDYFIRCTQPEGHDGPHADWSPSECLVEGCACTEVEEPALCPTCGARLAWRGGADVCLVCTAPRGWDQVTA